MAPPVDRETAQALVRRIAKDHGYLGEDVLQRLEPDLRLEIEEAFLKKDLMIGSSVITLAKNLYTNKARFVFELLQNADDNVYKRAKDAGVEPYVAFHVHPQKIVVECNEDGFESQNLEAICSVGKSSKKGAQGYIGEKGIGFKSVFMAAWKVHIQSGAFSFSFKHRRGDSGMGMISPVWEDYRDDSLAPSVTRITLHLHDTKDTGAEELAGARKVIVEQFQELQETMLLFMKNLKQIRVSFYAEDGEQTSCTKYAIEEPQSTPGHALLHKTIGAAAKHTSHFHVTTYEATGLAKNDNRTYSPDEEATRAYSNSKVVLVFPLSEESIPIVQPQDLFVFLPVRSVGFSFIIQADFVTDASRQDVVRDSLRNVGLLDAIASAFSKAVLQFCNHPTLRYQWMRYLPKKSENRDSLWATLVGKIATNLAGTSVLFGHKTPNVVHRIESLLRLSYDLLDESGLPLLDDEPECIVSRSYAPGDLDRLKEYGLKNAYYSNFTDWLQKDLQRGAQSRMKSADMTSDWHRRVATVLCRAFDEKLLAHEIPKLKQMPLVPLENGAWTSTSSGSVWFPRAQTIDIPPNLGFRLVAKETLTSARRQLFKCLGVATATDKLVRETILEQYPRIAISVEFSLQASIKYLEILYRTEHLETDQPRYTQIAIHTSHEGNLRRPRSVYVYFRDDHPYGPYELCRKTDSGTLVGCGAPGFPANIVNDAYFEASPTQPDHQPLAWREWFRERLGVKNCFHLGDKGAEGREYLRKHRPEKFLGALHRYYEEVGGVGFDRDFFVSLAETEVLCRDGTFWTMKDAYFPTVELEKRVKRFLEPGAFFPWLWIDDPELPYETIPSGWKGMLSRVQSELHSTDVDFALNMLRHAAKSLPSTPTAASQARLLSLYEHIYTKYCDSEDEIADAEAERIRKGISHNMLIYIPPGPHGLSWVGPEKCVWGASMDLTSKHVLQHLYERHYDKGSLKASAITPLFTNILKIPNSGWQTYVGEAEALKKASCDDISKITKIYKALKALWFGMSGGERDNLKSSFESSALIFVPSKDGSNSSWHKTSQCVWSSAARLRGRASLNDDYESLKELFVDLLGVRPVDLSMAISELAEEARKSSTTVSEIKESIWAVNSLLLATSNMDTVDQLDPNLSVFPVRFPSGGSMRLASPREFFVVDREPLRKAFEGKVKFLDFNLKEVGQLSSFLKWARLDDRYLSRQVQEYTSFVGGGATAAPHREERLQTRAYALLRIAAHHSSPRTTHKSEMDRFYTILRNIEVFQTDGISSGFKLMQGESTVLAESQKATVHIDEHSHVEGDSGTSVKVYLPRRNADQEYAFASYLPEKLLQWMMQSPGAKAPAEVPREGVAAIKDVLTAPPSRLSLALDDSGISSIDVVNVDVIVDEDEEDDEDEVINEQQQQNVHTTPQRNRVAVGGSVESTPDEREEDYFGDGYSSSEALVTPSTSVGTASPEWSRKGDATTSRALFTPTRATRQLSRQGVSLFGADTLFGQTPTSPSPAVGENIKYVALLSRTISAARQRALPTGGLFSLEGLAASLLALGSAGNGSLDLGLRALSQFERDCRVGAAGELYVFELLSHVSTPRNLSDFSRANWQSTIRKFVTAHPDYVDMEPWTGRETSDIVYKDTLGDLTELLIESGYLGESLRSQQATYYIEVKTTTLSCETPFYMSKAQYQRMRDNTIPDDRAGWNKNIYVVFRVFNLGRENVGVRIYVDPEKLRLDNTLKFTSESWSVVPS